MNMRSTSLAAAILLLSFTAGTSIAESPINTRSYQCQELIDLVAERKKVVLRGFLGTSRSVHASPASCENVVQKAVKSSWRTKNVFSCAVGYTCNSAVGLEGFGT